MKQLHVQVDNALRFQDRDLDELAKQMLWNALALSNPENRDEQIILLRRAADRRLVVPRGFAVKLKRGFQKMGIDVIWDDQRVRVPAEIPAPLDNIEDLPYQQRALHRLVTAEQGIYEGPTASGKTITASLIISAIQQRTIVIVDRIEIAYQWRDRVFETLGIIPTIIGDGAWNDSGSIVICLRQSLWARRDQLKESGFFKQFGCVMLDECHAVSAETVREIFGLFYSYYRFGFSATPDRHDWLTIASRAVIGEILCRTTEEELEAAGRLVKPRVVAFRTPFKFQWKTLGTDTRVQWRSMLKKLKTDPARNKLIGKIMEGQRGQTMLVQTSEHTHVDELAAIAYASGWPMENVLFFTGKTSGKDRMRIRERAEHGDCIIISTIGKEALDRKSVV